MNEDEQIIWGLPVSFLDFVLGFLITPNQKRVEFIPKADPLKFYGREKVTPPSQNLGEIRDANKERVNKSLSNYASNNFLLSTSNIRPDLNGRYNPGLGLFAGDLTALTLSMGFDPFNASNYYKVATQIPKFRNWGLTRLLANELNNEVRVAGELGKNVGSATLFVFPLFKNVIRTVQNNGKIRLSLPSHTEANPRQFVLEPLGNNKFYVHMRTWDGDHIPANLSNKDKLTLFQALYDELPEGGEILFPKSGPGYYGTRGTVAGLLRLSRDSRFTPGTKGTLQYLDKDGTIKTYEGTSFIKSPTILQEPSTSLRFFTENPKLAKTLTNGLWDAGYLPAVKNKDLVEAQNLRDLHFQVSAPNTKVKEAVFNGNRYNKPFYEFNTNFRNAYWGGRNDYTTGAWFGTGDKNTLFSFAGDDPNRLKKFYLNFSNPFIKDAGYRRWDKLLPFDMTEKDIAIEAEKLREKGFPKYVIEDWKKGIETTTDNYALELINTDYDSGIIKNVYEGKAYPDSEYGVITDYIASKPNQIKSADAITYDNAGNIIPLSRRDNFISSDIRYQNGGKLVSKNVIQKFKGRIK